MNAHKKSFTVKIDGQDVTVAVMRPTAKLVNEGDKVYAKKFAELIKSGMMINAEVEAVAKERGLMPDQAKLEELAAQINANELTLKKGGLKLYGTGKDSAQGIIFDTIRKRRERSALFSGVSALQSHTAETYAEASRFNYLVSSIILFDEDKTPVFKSEADYLDKLSKDDEVATKGTSEAATLLYGDPVEARKELFENKLGVKYKLLDDQLRPINKEGKLIDFEGRVIDENGFYLNDQGQRVDKDGNLLDENSEYIVDFLPFLDENDQPIELGVS